MEWQSGGGPVYIWGSERVYRQRWRADRSTGCRSEPVLPGSAGVKVYGLEKAELMEFLQWLAEQRGYRTEDTPSSISCLNFRPFVCTNAQTDCVRATHRLEARR